MNKKIADVLIPALAAVLTSAIAAFGQTKLVEVDQELIRFAIVSDSRLIKYLADDFLIPEVSIDKMRIYDIQGDGFGDGDLARVYPSGKLYVISPSKEVQNAMNRWKFGDNIKFTAHASDSPEELEASPDSVRALGGIFAGLLRGLRRNYKGQTFKLYMEQNTGVAAVEMWDYDKNRLQYRPPVEKNKEVEKPVYNLIYLEKMISDTVYTSPPQAIETGKD